MTTPTTIIVVIPARDEEELIGSCLASVLEARSYALSRVRGAAVHVFVVADSCRDETAAIARGFAGVTVLEVDATNVGRARRMGVEAGLEASRPVDAEGAASWPDPTVWIANTDADSVVPQNWLLEQVHLARRGVQLMIGTVRPRFDDLTWAQVRAWEATRTGTANGHVHGANLGIRADVYLEAGGFPALAEHEDVDLAARCAALGAKTVATMRCEVTTSGRSVGRTPGGYARYLTTDLLADPLV
jgi:glycosyltransferase involved in cell wall biosynthesis